MLLPFDKVNEIIQKTKDTARPEISQVITDTFISGMICAYEMAGLITPEEQSKLIEKFLPEMFDDFKAKKII